jgi:hypothetical protein
MADTKSQSDATATVAVRSLHQYRFVLLLGVVALIVTSIPYVLGAALATEERVFGGFVYATEDCYSYLAKMRQGAEGAWLFHIAYTPEPHRGALFYPFHLMLGKVAASLPGGDLTARMVWVYHGARVIFGLLLLLTVYRFLAEFTERVVVRRLAWLMVTFGGGLGWLLVTLGQPGWLGSMPLDFILPEGFTFLVLYGFPHIALARSLLLGGILCLLRAWEARPESASRAERFKWAGWTGFMWLVMGLIVPFYVPVAWAVMGAAWLTLGLRERRVPWQEGGVAVGAALVSSLIVLYSAWVFVTHPVFETWGAQNLILSPHPLHYVAAYGIPLVLAAFAVWDVWRSKGPTWVALAWVAVVPILVYLPINVQRRLVEGVQVPLSLLASLGLVKALSLRNRLSRRGSRLAVGVVMVALALTNVMLVAGNCLALLGQPAPMYRDAGEVAVMDWLAGDERVEHDDVVLAAYETGNYLPARVRARSFVGLGPESIRADEKKAMVARFFGGTTDDLWRRGLLSEYGVDWVFWGPAERELGDADLSRATYLRQVYEAQGYAVFEVAK